MLQDNRSASPAVLSSQAVGRYVETLVGGRVTGPMLDQMVDDYRRLLPAPGAPWLIRAETARSYAHDAIARAVDGFSRLVAQCGLRRLVAVVTAPSVRMGASVVAMSLRAAGSPLAIIVVGTIEEAPAALRG